MRKEILAVAFCMTIFALSAASQTNTFPTSGNVGIGTTSPQGILDVLASGGKDVLIGGGSNTGSEIKFLNTSVAHFSIYNSGNGNLTVANTSSQGLLNVAGTPILSISNGGNVGIGTTSPNAKLQINGSSLSQSFLSFGDTAAGGSTWIMGPGTGSGSTGFGLYTGSAVAAYVLQNGNVGIGTNSPLYNLDVLGVARAQAGIIYPDGNKQTTAWTGVLCGGDYAESVDVSGSRTNYEPGDVLVIGAESGADVAKSAEPYSTFVVGVYSTKPGMTGRRQTIDAKVSKTEVPMAMIGIVPTKVSTENGPVKRGDLLVTSSTPGYAMKGTDRERMLGAVIGKALGNLDSGMGVIEVVVTLQ